MSVDAQTWLLPFNFDDGHPWGTGTYIAKRKKAGKDPWDTQCEVTPLIGGYRAMYEIRDTLEQLIKKAKAATNLNAGEKGHVYIADWRLNALRDFSDANYWKTGTWYPPKQPLPQPLDQTAIGLILRLMQAGVAVRIMVWMPTPAHVLFVSSLKSHVADHAYLKKVIDKENDRLQKTLNPTVPLGIVALDARTASGAVSASHHQKMMVIRSPSAVGVNVAFVGGVDLAFTRRDAPADPTKYDPNKVTFLDGDWQSANQMPPDLKQLFATNKPPGSKITWPPDSQTDYTSVAQTNPPSPSSTTDLPLQTNDDADVCAAVGGKFDEAAKTCEYFPNDGTTKSKTPVSIYGTAQHIWHDQHLRVRGPIVSTIEWQFKERWDDPGILSTKLGDALDKDKIKNWFPGRVIFSSDVALDKTKDPPAIVPLPTPVDEPGIVGASSTVQMWRTIPLRDERSEGDVLDDGEFTVMSGYANAMSTAKELIWIFDQYFWSEATTRLLNHQVKSKPSLRVIIILPPFADGSYQQIHKAREFALGQLMHGLTDDQAKHIAVYDLWQPVNHDPKQGRGIYVHAKTHTYDRALLVCGSANVNRRSLLCDTELCCAVFDPDLVLKHQQNLWNLLFRNVPSSDGDWDANIDLNLTGSGAKFLDRFKQAATWPDAFVVPDPWDNDNPAHATKAPVALPNGVPRKRAFPGPVFEIMYAEGLDPSGLDRGIEEDVLERLDSIPRPPRLDDLVYAIEQNPIKYPSGKRKFPRRKHIDTTANPAVTFPAVRYTDERSYWFTENAEWWRRMCLGLPCFLAQQWPGYGSKIKTGQIDGHDVVVQLWKGYCERAAGIKGMPGGVGAEVGLYRRIPNSQLPSPDDLIKKLPAKYRAWAEEIVAFLRLSSVTDWWWPFPEVNPKIKFTLTDPTGRLFFACKEEDTWWACKWMDKDSFDRFQQDTNTNTSWTGYTLDWTVTGLHGGVIHDFWT